MSDDVQYMLGQLQAGINTLSENQAKFRQEQREDNKQIFDKINDLAANGCAIGKQHAKDIEELKKRPERLVGIGAAMASILAMIGSAFVWALGRGH
jgi:hypothetical protein